MPGTGIPTTNEKAGIRGDRAAAIGTHGEGAVEAALDRGGRRLAGTFPFTPVPGFQRDDGRIPPQTPDSDASREGAGTST